MCLKQYFKSFKIFHITKKEKRNSPIVSQIEIYVYKKCLTLPKFKHFCHVFFTLKNFYFNQKIYRNKN